jgi:PAS domain S-box-containing protein
MKADDEDEKEGTMVVLTVEDRLRHAQIDQFLDKYWIAQDKKALYLEYKDVLDHVQPLDMFYITHFSDAQGFSVEEIRKLAGKLVNVFSHGFNAYRWNRDAFEIIHLLQEDNQAMMDELLALKPKLAKDQIRANREAIVQFLVRMECIEKKFAIMQNIVFPVMERVLPEKKVFQVLWMVQDELSAKRKSILEMLHQDAFSWEDLIRDFGAFYYELAGLIQKESAILFPVLSLVLDDSTNQEMVLSAEDIGFALLKTDRSESVREANPIDPIWIETSTGNLTLEQFVLVMSSLPVAITYVNEDNIVTYYNEPKERHFPRTPQAIGREVRHCHPQKSVHIVEEIIERFRDGSRSHARFWFDFRGRKLLVQYLAVYDKEKHYRGVLEVTEDITDIKEYTGEKRLLDWE